MSNGEDYKPRADYRAGEKTIQGGNRPTDRTNKSIE